MHVLLDPDPVVEMEFGEREGDDAIVAPLEGDTSAVAGDELGPETLVTVGAPPRPRIGVDGEEAECEEDEKKGTHQDRWLKLC